jgi:DNA-directed RNA polymerase specialized sigma subunit
VHKAVDEEWVKRADNDTQVDDPVDTERVLALMLEKIYKKMNALGEQGEVLRMSFIEGKSTKEIAAKLGCTENAVYLIKSRGLKALRSKLSKNQWLFFLCIFMGGVGLA